MDPKNATNNVLYLNNMPQTCKPADLIELFGKFGHIRDINIQKQKKRYPEKMTYGFVKFSKWEDALKAKLEIGDNAFIFGQQLTVGWATAEQVKSEKAEKKENNTIGVLENKNNATQVLVSYKSDQVEMVVTEDSLCELFCGYGQVIYRKILNCSITPAVMVNGKERKASQCGHGFIHFSNDQAGVAAATRAVNDLQQPVDGVHYDCSYSFKPFKSVDPPCQLASSRSFDNGSTGAHTSNETSRSVSAGADHFHGPSAPVSGSHSPLGRGSETSTPMVPTPPNASPLVPHATVSQQQQQQPQQQSNYGPTTRPPMLTMPQQQSPQQQFAQSPYFTMVGSPMPLSYMPLSPVGQQAYNGMMYPVPLPFSSQPMSPVAYTNVSMSMLSPQQQLMLSQQQIVHNSQLNSPVFYSPPGSGRVMQVNQSVQQQNASSFQRQQNQAANDFYTNIAPVMQLQQQLQSCAQQQTTQLQPHQNQPNQKMSASQTTSPVYQYQQSPSLSPAYQYQQAPICTGYIFQPQQLSPQTPQSPMFRVGMSPQQQAAVYRATHSPQNRHSQGLHQQQQQGSQSYAQQAPMDGKPSPLIRVQKVDPEQIKPVVQQAVEHIQQKLQEQKISQQQLPTVATVQQQVSAGTSVEQNSVTSQETEQQHQQHVETRIEEQQEPPMPLLQSKQQQQQSFEQPPVLATQSVSHGQKIKKSIKMSTLRDIKNL